MRRIILLGVIFLHSSWQIANCQVIRVQLAHPISSLTKANYRSSFRGSIWITPEWKWVNGTYISVPGYWAKPHRKGLVWVPGRWVSCRNEYRWTPGRWK